MIWCIILYELLIVPKQEKDTSFILKLYWSSGEEYVKQNSQNHQFTKEREKRENSVKKLGRDASFLLKPTGAKMSNSLAVCPSCFRV